MPPSPIVLAGATASGKSAVALALARQLHGEIVSVDSMQVYRGLDIGTAKPSLAERAEIPHHLIDQVNLEGSFDAAAFVRQAEPLIQQIKSRGRTPILCGGTGLYFSAWLGGLGDAPAPDPKLRAELESLPLPQLLDELARLDFTSFDEIDTANRRRVVRAVEVIRLTGQPFSTQRAKWAAVPAELQGRCFGLQRERDDLHRRIHSRVDDMFARGLVEETKRLLDHGLLNNRTAMQAIGYRQVVEHLQGARGIRDTIELIKTKTRQFSKRQGTWFRGQMDLQWIHVAEKESPEITAQNIRSFIGA